MQTNLIINCSVWGNCFYLKFAKMSLKMFRKRCAWWSLKISVGRKRIDLSPQPPSTTPETRTEQVVQPLPPLPNIQKMQGSEWGPAHCGGWTAAPQITANHAVMQQLVSGAEGPPRHCRCLWLLCKTPGMWRLIPASMDRLHPAQRSSSTWDLKAATLYWLSTQ